MKRITIASTARIKDMANIEQYVFTTYKESLAVIVEMNTAYCTNNKIQKAT